MGTSIDVEYRIGDKVKGDASTAYGDRISVILSFHTARSIAFCEDIKRGMKLNIPVSDLRLVDSDKRPMKRVNEASLIKLCKMGQKEALRERIIRQNSK